METTEWAKTRITILIYHLAGCFISLTTVLKILFIRRNNGNIIYRLVQNWSFSSICSLSGFHWSQWKDSHWFQRALDHTRWGIIYNVCLCWDGYFHTAAEWFLELILTVFILLCQFIMVLGNLFWHLCNRITQAVWVSCYHRIN